MTATVLCALRAGREYDARHVAWLAGQVARHSGSPLVAVSDVDVPVTRIPMRHDWPGWWCKMEIFRPDLPGDVFFLDLDTVLVGGIDDLATIGRTTLLRDFGYPAQLQSSVMYLTAADRARVWERWIADPGGIMARLRGDQDFLGEMLPDADRWQDVAPERFVSYRKQIRNAGRLDPPPGCSVVVFHGRPRPWRRHLLGAFPWLGRPHWIPPLPRT